MATEKITIPMRELTAEDLSELSAHTRAKIKAHVAKCVSHQPSYIYSEIARLHFEIGVSRKFLQDNVVCMSCGHSEILSTYPVAQIAMGHKIRFTCNCGHVTTLPQNID